MSKSNIDLKRLSELVDRAMTAADRRRRLGEQYRRRVDERREAERAFEIYKSGAHAIRDSRVAKSSDPRPDRLKQLEDALTNARFDERRAREAQDVAGNEASPIMTLARRAAEHAREVLGDARLYPDIIDFLDH